MSNTHVLLYQKLLISLGRRQKEKAGERGEEKKPSNGFDVPPATPQGRHPDGGLWVEERGNRRRNCECTTITEKTLCHIIVRINVFSIILFITRQIIDTFFFKYTRMSFGDVYNLYVL